MANPAIRHSILYGKSSLDRNSVPNGKKDFVPNENNDFVPNGKNDLANFKMHLLSCCNELSFLFCIGNSMSLCYIPTASYYS